MKLGERNCKFCGQNEDCGLYRRNQTEELEGYNDRVPDANLTCPAGVVILYGINSFANVMINSKSSPFNGLDMSTICPDPFEELYQVYILKELLALELSFLRPEANCHL